MKLLTERSARRLTSTRSSRTRRLGAVAKRAIDLAVAGSGLLVLSPLVMVIAVVVRATSRGPAFFRQERIGLGGRPFEIIKFRTMTASNDDTALREMIRLELTGEAVPAEDGSFKTAEDSRITSIGRWLRHTSLDEVPQLVNVIRGEMSLVGPRPALPWEVEMFPAKYQCRADVLPGLTGLWQVSGRGWLDTLDMLRLDLEYVQTRSLRLDLSILLRTVPVMLRSDGTR